MRSVQRPAVDEDEELSVDFGDLDLAAEDVVGRVGGLHDCTTQKKHVFLKHNLLGCRILSRCGNVDIAELESKPFLRTLEPRQRRVRAQITTLPFQLPFLSRE